MTPERLAQLDERERNYVRVDVTDRLRPRPPGATWAYVGRPESRARLRRARERSHAVVSREYRERVMEGFAGLGRDALARFRRSTELEGTAGAGSGAGRARRARRWLDGRSRRALNCGWVGRVPDRRASSE